MPDILFSHSYFYRLDAKQWKNKTPFPPLGTLHAAALMRENGFGVELFDTNLLPGPDGLSQILDDKLPDFLVLYDDGFNYLTKMCLTSMREACFSMIAMAKSRGCKVVACSSDASDHFEKYLSAGADFVIRGEGEMTLLELLNAIASDQPVSDVKGLAYLHDGFPKITAARPVMTYLDALPLPAWDLIDMNAYKLIWHESGKPFTLNIATTRGCPFKCNWCAKPIYGNRYNSHSPEYIADHIQLLRESYGVRRFWMCDDIFGLKSGWVEAFGNELRLRNLDISYYIQSRVDLLLKENTIDALAASGLEEVWVGAESASQKILDAMDKGTTVEQIRQATQLLKAKGIRVAFFLQFGYLGENEDDIRKTIAMVRELMPDDIGVSVSYPLPGTKFHDMVKDDLARKANWIDSDDFDMMFNGTYNTPFYRRLQRFVHKDFRKRQALSQLRGIAANPMRLSRKNLKAIAKLGWYVTGAYLDRQALKKLRHGH
jgi:anaerobic magnesium-protoporphyrin IX monomethyl ester cyclase